MTTLEIILVVFGMGPIIVIFVYKAIGVLPMFGIGRPLRTVPYQSSDVWYHVPNPVPWKQIGGSLINMASGIADVLSGTKEPQFSTLHCKAHQTSKAKWRLEIEFEIRNPRLNQEIVIDDMHACLFETDAFAPPLATISYYGDVWLKQDNTILKEKRDYSLAPGDGYIIKLLFEATRIEAAPAYGSYPSETEGRAVAVFGLILDYYSKTLSGIDRRTIPSDCIYLFRYSSSSEITAINSVELQRLKISNIGNKQAIEFIQRLEKHLADHLAFRPTPVS